MRLSTIADKIAYGEELSQKEFSTLKKRIGEINEGHRGDIDDVVSKVVLHIKNNYNPEYEPNEKGSWLYKIIIGICADEGDELLNGTLYSPAPSSISDVESTDYEDMIDTVNASIMEEKFLEILTDTEKYIYLNYIKGYNTLSEIGEHFGITGERVRQIKDKTIEKIKDYIEKYLI